MKKANGMKMLGVWGKNFFIGCVYLKPENGLKNNNCSTHEVESNSNYAEVRKAISFNCSPIEILGKFRIKDNLLFLHQIGVIVFEDGSKY